MKEYTDRQHHAKSPKIPVGSFVRIRKPGIINALDYSTSNQEQRIRQHINKTVFVGETVTLHCNKTPLDEDLTWKMNKSVIFSHDSNRNRTLTNFSSNRIHINPVVLRELKIHQIKASDAGNYTCYPATIRWTLAITGYFMISFVEFVVFNPLTTLSQLRRKTKYLSVIFETAQLTPEWSRHQGYKT
ncbi:hypothetical protein DPX16_0337 [Anabarilius grahami]|uniref:Ig-like domain-containing protein n=1 Tax=Anabarilius grahami TaxID=495550 RepID=A0A3N0YK53_ANAGA|nr:hypothetical protein DPX16_0337 [Anabarilius grahami]